MERPGSRTPAQIIRVRDGQIHSRKKRDALATEEPMEIRLVTQGQTQQVAITMRTPGADFELAAGFLFAEGIIHSREDIAQITYCVDADLDEAQRYNVVNVQLRGHAFPELRGLERHFVVNSACGVCGKSNLDALSDRGLEPVKSELQVSPEFICELPDKMRETQRLFESTGGLHAAALFNTDGELLALREDVGRHNALDKLIGWTLLEGYTSLEDCVLLVSGRASYELVQKALTMKIPVFCAISAPSSLAVDLARRFEMTLIGFLRGQDFNIYHGAARIK